MLLLALLLTPNLLLQVKLVKEGLIPITIPCLHVDGVGNIGSW